VSASSETVKQSFIPTIEFPVALLPEPAAPIVHITLYFFERTSGV